MKSVKHVNLLVKMLRTLSPLALIVTVVMLLAPACAGKRQPLESFSDAQKTKMFDKSAYVQADLDFWSALYEPTLEDIEGLRAAWVEHGQAFPESRPFAEIEKEVRRTSQRVVLVALFMTNYENADLLNKSLGWSVSPVPNRITELSETDVVLRQLMPVKNQWPVIFCCATRQMCGMPRPCSL